jgi:hypothetical protein
MPNREALGRTVNVVPIAAGVGLSLKGAGGITFVCTGNDTFTITVASSPRRLLRDPGQHHHDEAHDHHGGHRRVDDRDAVRVERGDHRVGCRRVLRRRGHAPGRQDAREGVTQSSSGLVTAVYSDLKAQRAPANLPIPSA